jgi:hypothetical protein
VAHVHASGLKKRFTIKRHVRDCSARMHVCVPAEKPDGTFNNGSESYDAVQRASPGVPRILATRPATQPSMQNRTCAVRCKDLRAMRCCSARYPWGAGKATDIVKRCRKGGMLRLQRSFTGNCKSHALTGHLDTPHASHPAVMPTKPALRNPS